MQDNEKESQAEQESSSEQRTGFLSSVSSILRRAEASGSAHSPQIAESIVAAARGPKR